MEIAAKSIDDLTSRLAYDKEGEKDFAAAVVPTTPADVNAQVERAEANEAAAKVVDAITSHEAEAEEIDDAIRADAHDEDLSITSAADAGDKENEDDDDDEADDPLFFPDAGKDLGDDDDDDDDDEDEFTIQYHTKPATTLKDEWVSENPTFGVPNDQQITQLKESLDQTGVKMSLRTSSCGEFDFLTEAKRLEVVKAEEELQIQRK
ncbi:uncharacterized protein LOC112506179 [Cynara cardunculus var. scolymus]|uniref:uncharacterized protein LOC112506179 n=1 Tax=Cynara cardunculus var. scolymus TaxID=59895 RepID=UPI000D629A44|nr:uncharacterized protein LOC112506179 [Cynara cardunculus var. scolymus]